MASGDEMRKREGSFPMGVRFGGERRKKEERKRGKRKEKRKENEKQRVRVVRERESEREIFPAFRQSKLDSPRIKVGHATRATRGYQN